MTLTLPEHVIETLTAGEPDLSRAIVRLTPASTKRAARPAELCHFGSHAVILVSPTRTLEKLAGVELVPLPDGRALIAFPPSRTAADLELLLEDAVDGPALTRADRSIFESVLEVIREARRSGEVSFVQRSIIVFETRRPPTPRKSAKSPV
ncbi:MAG: hypothetical protein H0W53_17675 [Acidobacteria bacterium]|nr:hypothetical protein [Acidobacteriota bacterium]